MNRPLTVVFSALEALLVVGIGIGIPLVPLTLMWGLQYGLQIDWIVFWRAAVDIWLLGNGANMTAILDEATATTLGFVAAQTPFVLSLAPLGFALFTLLMGQRAGRRIAEVQHRNLGLLVALATFGLLSLILTLTALHELARPSIVQGAIVPTLVFAAGLALGTVVARSRLAGTRPDDVLDRLWARMSDQTARVTSLVSTALVGGAASVAVVMLVSSVLLAVLFGVNYGEIIALYEGTHAGVLGGVALTLAQLAFVPNLVIWGASWLVGPGFALGAGSVVSPLGTSLGPVPAIPVLGALPTGDFAWGFLGLLVPVVAGFLIGAILRPRLKLGFAGKPPLRWQIATGALIGACAGIILGLLAWFSAGSAGPGRLAEIGPNPLLVGLLTLLEVGIAATLGLIVASAGGRPEEERADASLS